MSTLYSIQEKNGLANLARAKPFVDVPGLLHEHLLPFITFRGIFMAPKKVLIALR